MEIFELLRKIEDSLQGVSCLPQEPFMKLGQGKAPILNYSLEQKSAFTSYGHFLIDVADKHFKGNATTIPPNNIFDQVAADVAVEDDGLASRSVPTILVRLVCNE